MCGCNVGGNRYQVLLESSKFYRLFISNQLCGSVYQDSVLYNYSSLLWRFFYNLHEILGVWKWSSFSICKILLCFDLWDFNSKKEKKIFLWWEFKIAFLDSYFLCRILIFWDFLFFQSRDCTLPHNFVVWYNFGVCKKIQRSYFMVLLALIYVILILQVFWMSKFCSSRSDESHHETRIL